jgi:mRNA interferase MazF
VLSPQNYNGKTNLAIFCPITSQIKGYPFEVVMPEGLPITGAVLADQVKSLDWLARNIELIGNVPSEIVVKVMEKLTTLLPE